VTPESCESIKQPSISIVQPSLELPSSISMSYNNVISSSNDKNSGDVLPKLSKFTSRSSPNINPNWEKITQGTDFHHPEDDQYLQTRNLVLNPLISQFSANNHAKAVVQQIASKEQQDEVAQKKKRNEELLKLKGTIRPQLGSVTSVYTQKGDEDEDDVENQNAGISSFVSANAISSTLPGLPKKTITSQSQNQFEKPPLQKLNESQGSQLVQQSQNSQQSQQGQLLYSNQKTDEENKEGKSKPRGAVNPFIRKDATEEAIYRGDMLIENIEQVINEGKIQDKQLRIGEELKRKEEPFPVSDKNTLSINIIPNNNTISSGVIEINSSPSVKSMKSSPSHEKLRPAYSLSSTPKVDASNLIISSRGGWKSSTGSLNQDGMRW